MTVVPLRLAQAIETHIFRNYAARHLGHAPLIMGIDGPPGEGKTISVQAVAEGAGVKSFLLSGGQLESPHSGRPAELIRDTYRAAGDWAQQERGRGALVVINDVDTGLGEWGDLVQYTVNRQTVIGELMHLCDFPERVEGFPTPRVPIVVTGNDFTRLYSPLLRAGRFRRFTWIPTAEEKVTVVASLDARFREDEVRRLVLEFPDQPVAFFSDLLSLAQEAEIRSALSQVGLAAALGSLAIGRYPLLRTSPTVDELIELGRTLEAPIESHLGVGP